VTELLDAMAAAHARWRSPRLADWYPEADRLARSREAMRGQAARVGDVDFGREFRDNVAVVVGDDPLAWANRRLDLGGGQWCVTGIRFRGMDVSKPFVDVVATSLPPDAASLEFLCARVVPVYEEFSPKAVRVDVPDPDALVGQVLAQGWGAEVDQYVVAGPVRGVRGRQAAAVATDIADIADAADGAAVTGDVADRVALVAGTPEALYPEVVRCYERIEAGRPDLPAWARPSTREELTECAEEGLLFEVRIDDDPAGVVAARRDDDFGMTGFVVQEIVLRPEFLGRRWGRTVLTHLAEALPAREDDVLWGTIHADNTPSLRNATSVGREIVGGYVWLTPPGLPGMD